MSHWVRLWEDMPTDPKWRVIARRSGRPIAEVLSVFCFMLTNAGASRERGTLDGWNDEDVGAALDMDAEHVAAIREAMQGKTLDGDRLTGWDRRQAKREREDDNSTERVKAHRERKRHETPGNAGEHPDKIREDENREYTETKAAQQLKPAAAPLDEVGYEEAERRCAQAVGIEGLRGFKAVHELMLNGVSLEGRILPVLREKAAEVARSHDKPVSWNYFLKAIQDPSRRGIKSEKPVALEFAPVGSPAWQMLIAAGKKESYLRSIIAKHKGVDGVWFPPTDYPATFRARHMQSEFPPANGAAA
jgi:hypothetical protein